MKIITAFRGRHYFLSNFYPAEVTFRGLTFPTAEHAFASAKTTDPDAISDIRCAATPAEAKAIGRTVSVVPNWESERFDVMATVLASKFSSAELSARLVATGGALLVEGNDWHDQTWGSCTCRIHDAIDGFNALGVLLMRERLRRRFV